MAAFATTLDAFAEGPPSHPGADVAVDVEEVDASSALTNCGLPGVPYSLNPYVGCAHACAYCYVPSVTHREQAEWGGWVRPKRNLPRILARELKRREPGLVFVSSATDPYQPLESRYRLTRRCLELLAREDWPVRVLTRSPLVLQDVDVLKRFSTVSVGLSIPTLDDAFRRVLEPGAPPVRGRLQALRDLHAAGIETRVSLAPTYPLTGGWTPGRVARAIAATGARRVWGSPWNYGEKAEPVTRARLEGTPFERYAPHLFQRGWQKPLMRDLAAAFRAKGVEFVVYQ